MDTDRQVDGYIYIYTYTQKDRNIERWKHRIKGNNNIDKQIDRQMGLQIERQMDRQTDSQIDGQIDKGIYVNVYCDFLISCSYLVKHNWMKSPGICSMRMQYDFDPKSGLSLSFSKSCSWPTCGKYQSCFIFIPDLRRAPKWSSSRGGR